MTDDELKARLFKELKDSIDRPVVSNEEPTWILACLRVVGPVFCMCVRGKDTYEIRMSPWRYSELVKDLEKDLDAIVKEYRYRDFTEPFWKEWDQARLKCEGVIGYFRNQYQDEKKKLEERIDLEEDVKRKYKRY